ncbi:MAG: FAD-dependent oxidoreductase [Pseudomonadota bacterium]
MAFFDRSGSDRKHVVIVGGGIGGLMLATQLGRRFRSDTSVDVSLIDRAPVHVWKPMLHTFAAGTANAHEDGVPMVAQAKRAGFTFLPGEFHALDRQAKRIAIRITDLPNRPPLNHQVRYDIAVIAIGSRANDFGTEGVQDHCHFIDTLWQAESLNQALREEIVYRIIEGGPIKIGVVGGGATGVEFSAETMRLMEAGSSYGHLDLREKLDLTLIDAGERLLGGFSPAISQKVMRKLQELGVSVRLNTQVAGADQAGFVLPSGERIEAAVRVWAAGVKAAAPLPGLEDFDRARSGQLIVGPTLQTPIDADVFALGDCASHTPGGAQRPLPPTGQVARQQADYLAKAIPARLAGSTPGPFTYRDRGSLVSLSQYGAYGMVGGEGPLPSLAIRGWLAKQAHSLFYRMHQFGLYGPARGSVLVLRDGLNTLIKPPIRLD